MPRFSGSIANKQRVSWAPGDGRGMPREWGVVPRALYHMLCRLKMDDDLDFDMRVSYVEIYRDRLHDLLCGGAPIELVHHRQGSKEHFSLSQAATVAITGMEDVLGVLEAGEAQKTVFATNMNARSSRSHCVFTVSLRQTSARHRKTLRSTYHLVDLAGSERQKKSGALGRQLGEMKEINRSLLCLQRCIINLSKSNAHVPYRDATLTKLLSHALNGSCRLAVIVTGALNPEHINEVPSISQSVSQSVNESINQSFKQTSSTILHDFIRFIRLPVIP